MSLRNLVTVVVFIVISSKVHSQNIYRNSVSFELGGHGYVYSFNYERQFKKGLAGRVGVSYFMKSILFPVTIGKIFGNKTHHFEITGGLVYFTYYQLDIGVGIWRNGLFATSFIGYRYQKPEKRFYFRVGLTPLYELYNSDPEIDRSPLFIWGGVGAGYRF